MNQAAIEFQGDTVTDVACQHFPGIAIAKEIMGDPTPTGVVGQYRITYRLTVQNSGSGPADYDLVDELGYGTGVTVVSAEVAATLPGTLTTNPGWDGDDDTALATGVTIDGASAGGVVEHVYTVTVVVETASTMTSTAADCTLQAGETGTGLSNTATVTGDWGESLDDACASLPVTTIAKSLTSVTPGPGGTYTLAYTVAVSRTGAGPAYRLDDTFAFGAAVTVEDVEVAAPAGLTANPGFDGGSDPLIVDGAAIAGGTTHVYTVTVEVSVDAASVTFDNSDCSIVGGETGSGFSNSAAATTNGVAATDDACAPVPAQLSIAKVVGSGGPVALGDGRYQVGYTVTVTNGSAGPGTYDLVDELAFGHGIDVVSADMANPVPGSIVSSSWDGQADTEVITGQSIQGATPSGPTVHVYTATVVVDVIASLSVDAADCVVGSTETGSGLSNRAALTTGTTESEAVACAPLPVTTFRKELVAVVPNGDGTFDLDYELTVERTGDGLDYSLSDTFRYSSAATILGVTTGATTPSGLPTNPAFDGVTDTSLVVDRAIADGEQHTYTMTVVVAVDTASVTVANSDCALTGAETGTGFSNSAFVTTNGVDRAAGACAPLSAITVDKTVTSGPTLVDGTRYRIEYALTVTNGGTGDGTYSLADELGFGDGITVDEASVINTTSGGSTANPGWTGTAAGDTSIVVDEPIAGAGSSDGTVHTFRVTVVASVPLGLSPASVDCTLAPGEVGTGLRNTAVLGGDSGTDAADACAQAPSDQALHVVKAVSDAQVSLGALLRYTITVTNTGDVAYTAANPARVVDDLTDVLDDAAWGDDATASAGTIEYAAPQLAWTGPLAVGAHATITYSVRVDAAVAGNLALRNTVATDAANANCPAGDLAPECATLTRVEVSPLVASGPDAPSGQTTPDRSGGAGVLPFTGGNVLSVVRVAAIGVGVGALLAFISKRRRDAGGRAPRST